MHNMCCIYFFIYRNALTPCHTSSSNMSLTRVTVDQIVNVQSFTVAFGFLKSETL